MMSALIHDSANDQQDLKGPSSLLGNYAGAHITSRQQQKLTHRMTAIT
jgi:hypothetical protein